ncbi:MAG: lipid-A-disaccharide synthase N-terminal domain-containing protein [Planctomycetota bacterium]
MQWLSSEKEKKSIIPASFWFLSIGGAAILFLYAVHRRDLVFTIGQGAGIFIYLRNLQLIRNEKHRQTQQLTVVGEKELSLPARKAV